MGQISDSLFDYRSRQYTILPAQHTSYRFDPTIFDISLLAAGEARVFAP